jgi:two-component system LytT family response regulator
MTHGKGSPENMVPMNLLVLDDEPAARDHLVGLLRGLGQTVAAFSDGDALLAHHNQHPHAPDGAVLDILLQGQERSGVDVARELRRQGFAGPVAFLSSSREYGPESYEVQAADYLLKPATPAAVADALRVMGVAVASQKARDEAFLLVTSKKMPRNLFFSDLMYVEVTGNRLHFHLSGGETVIVRGALKDYAPALLADGRFVASHRAFIVNLDYVASVRGDTATLLDGSIVHVAKTHIAFKEKFIRRKSGGSNG